MATANDHLANARALVAQDRMFEAIDAYNKAIDADPVLADAYVELGRIELMRREVYDEAGTDKSDRSETFIEALKKAEGLVDHGLELAPNHVLGHAVKGLARALDLDWRGAVGFLEKAVAADDALTFAHFNLGRAYFETGNMARAEVEARKVLEQNPKHFQAYFGLGQILIKLGKMKEGLDSILQALRVNPFYVPSYLFMAEFFLRTSKFEAGEKLVREGLRHVPSAPALYDALIKLCMAQQDTKKALDAAVHVLRVRGDATDYMTVGNLELASGSIDKAEKAYKKAAELAPQAWEPYFNLGELYGVTVVAKNERDAQHFQELARGSYLRAQELAGNNYKIQNALALMEMKAGTVEACADAAKMFEAALALNPDGNEARYNLALCLAKTGENGRARQYVMDVIGKTRPGSDLHQQGQRLLGTLSKLR
ncbi:MAG: tetratricopeptide repeat protein [Candidatus Schekmanbacteria bacterium]|nr:tetratricopeptide repeat protein [Candidatus Schekmanbacteria bacterium]